MSNYNTQLQTNNSSLEEIIAQLNELPEAGGADPVLQDKTVTPTTGQQTITADSGYDGLDTVTVNAMPTATQATPSITVNSSGLITATATQAAGYVAAGTKSATKQLTTQAAQTITPGTTNKTISSGRYLTGAQTIKGDANLVASNIVKGKSIFGVTGTATGSGSTFPNGTEWTASNITSGEFYRILHGGDVWVAIGKEGFYYSIDGKVWTKSITPSTDCNLLCYGDGIWLASNIYAGPFPIYYSTDGKTWTEYENTIQNISSLYYANGLFYLTSDNLYYSTDGANWTKVSNLGVTDPKSVCYGKGLWVVTGANGVVYSSNGMTSWKKSNLSSDSYYGAHYANGIWHIYGINKGFFYSTDGKVWTLASVNSTISTSYYFDHICYSNGVWNAAGDTARGMYYSTDGINWNQCTWNTSIFNNASYRYINYANGIWVSSGGSWERPTYSFDGKQWLNGPSIQGFPKCCYHANGIWVMGTTSGLYYSITWEPTT